MQPRTASANPPEPTFQGMLAAIAAPQKKFPPGRDEDGLTSDFATFSDQVRRMPAADAPPGPGRDERAFYAPSTVTEAEPPQSSISEAEAEASHGDCVLPVSDPFRKCASVTIRLTEQESALLKERSAEAGFTVSAYLRSCAFEVENLRAQVKATVAQLQSAAALHPVKTDSGNWPRAWFRWWRQWRVRAKRHRTLG